MAGDEDIEALLAELEAEGIAPAGQAEFGEFDEQAAEEALAAVESEMSGGSSEGSYEPELNINEAEYEDLGPRDAAMQGPQRAVKNAAQFAGDLAMGTAETVYDLGRTVVGSESAPGEIRGEVGAGLDVLSQVPGAIAEGVMENPEAAIAGTGRYAAGAAGGVTGAKFGAVVGSALGPPGMVIGGGIGGALGFAGGMIGFDDALDFILGQDERNKSESIGEATEAATSFGLGNAIARGFSKVTGGRGPIRRRSQDVTARSKASRSVSDNLTKMALVRRGGLPKKKLESAMNEIGDEFIAGHIAKGTTKGRIAENTLDILRKKDVGLLDKYGNEVNNYLRLSDKKFKMDEVKRLINQSVDETLRSIDATADITPVVKKISKAVQTGYLKKAGYKNPGRTMDTFNKYQAELKKINKAIEARVGQGDELFVDGGKLSVLQKRKDTVLEQLDTIQDAVNKTELSAEDYWTIVREQLKTNKLNYENLDVNSVNEVVTKFRKLSQDSIKEGMDEATQAGYSAVNKKYSAAKTLDEWAENVNNAGELLDEGLDINVVREQMLNAKRELTRTTRDTPGMIDYLRRGEDAYIKNTNGTPTTFRALSDVVMDRLPQTLGDTVESVFSIENVAALSASIKASEEFLANNPPTPEEQEFGIRTSEELLRGLSALSQVISQGRGVSEVEKLAALKGVSKDPLISSMINFDSNTGQEFEGVASLGGTPLSQEDVKTYFANLAIADMTNFEKSKRRRYFNEKKKFYKPLEVEDTGPEVDNAEVQRIIQKEKAIDSASRYSSGTDVVKYRNLTEAEREKKKTKLEGVQKSSSLPIDFDSYAEVLGKRESSNNYQAVNKIGYVGKYQFGLAALIDAGFVKPSYAGRGNRALNNSNAWKKGMDLDTFLNSPELQEEAMRKYTEQNLKVLRRIGVIDDESTPEEIAGALAASHLKGPGGAKKLIVGGQDNKDGFGTKASEYLALGKRSQRTKRA